MLSKNKTDNNFVFKQPLQKSNFTFFLLLRNQDSLKKISHANSF